MTPFPKDRKNRTSNIEHSTSNIELSEPSTQHPASHAVDAKREGGNLDPRTQPPAPRALLLIGPTGAGKTPLGEHAEQHGYNGHSCTHFDFGEALRHIDVTKITVGSLTSTDITFIHKVLTEGALLEDETFYIAEELIKAHIRKSKLTPSDYLLLNGLPRHIGQANAIDKIVNIEKVIHLHCTPETVYARISQNSGGDRTSRTDDTTKEIAKKLKIFETRTKPLLKHYTDLNIPITTIEITPHSTPESIWDNI